MNFRKIITKLITIPQTDYGPKSLGRWNTIVTQQIKERRIDLANIDSCGDEICSNPKKLKMLYPNQFYLENKS